jgi:electron transfer flavoprotein beta subunit
MRIVICVKQVLDPRGFTVNRKAEKVVVNREEYMLDPASEAALWVAAMVKAAIEASNGSMPPEIVAISLGPDRVDDALREAMAFGADRAIHLNDAVFEGADAMVVANALAVAIGKLDGADLVLLGARSLDTGSGELAPRLAEALDLPHAANAVSLDVREGRAQIVAKHGASFTRFSVSLPVVVSLIPEAFEVGYASGWRLMDAYKKWSVEEWSAADLGLSEDDMRPMAVKKGEACPAERQLGTRVGDAAELAEILRRERVI